MIILNPNWLLERVGVKADQDLVELLTIFMMRFREASNKEAFLKKMLRKALDVQTGRVS